MLGMLLPPYIVEMLPDKHEARFFSQVVKQLTPINSVLTSRRAGSHFLLARLVRHAATFADCGVVKTELSFQFLPLAFFLYRWVQPFPFVHLCAPGIVML